MLSVEDIVNLLAIDLLEVIPEDENVMVSTNKCMPITLDDKSLTSNAFRNIALRLTGNSVPFLNLDEKKGLFGRLARLVRSGGN